MFYLTMHSTHFIYSYIASDVWLISDRERERKSAVLHDWCNKGRGMYYPVCGMMHIKEPLLLIGKSSPCCGSGFPLSLSGSITICLTI